MYINWPEINSMIGVELEFVNESGVKWIDHLHLSHSLCNHPIIFNLAIKSSSFVTDNRQRWLYQPLVT